MVFVVIQVLKCLGVEGLGSTVLLGDVATSIMIVKVRNLNTRQPDSHPDSLTWSSHNPSLI